MRKQQPRRGEEYIEQGAAAPCSKYSSDKAIECKLKDTNADKSELEQKIDRMVYELCGLTDEEAGIVEEETR